MIGRPRNPLSFRKGTDRPVFSFGRVVDICPKPGRDLFAVDLTEEFERTEDFGKIRGQSDDLIVCQPEFGESRDSSRIVTVNSHFYRSVENAPSEHSVP